MMQRQVDHMVRLVDDLMEVSRITRGMIELRPDQTDLGTILRGAVEQSGPVIESFGHELIISLPEDPLPIFGDVIRLGQVFANLLNNAARYTDQSGRIWLSAGQEGNEAVVTVRDTGIGIEPAMLPAIFGLFAQADTSRTRSQSGLGIGLTLAKRLVEMHAGTISARSEGLGQGSEFIVRLPLAEVPAPVPGESGNGEPGSDLVLRRVLVVDDNADSADSLGMLLRSLGTEVRTVYDGPLALEVVQDYRPDAVFLDIGMPGMDGLEVARRIRRYPGLEGVLLVALTGWGQPTDRELTRAAGFDHHLVKPAQPHILRRLLAETQDDRMAGAASPPPFLMPPRGHLLSS